MKMLNALTHLGPSLVTALRGTVEMEILAKARSALLSLLTLSSSFTLSQYIQPMIYLLFHHSCTFIVSRSCLSAPLGF